VNTEAQDQDYILNKKLSCRRGGATIHVLGSFAKSLKVIRNYTTKYRLKFLLLFHRK